MAERLRKPIFSANAERGLQQQHWGLAAGLQGERLINKFISEFPPPLNVGAMLIAWCSDIWKPPRRGQIAQAFIGKIFEVVTPTL